VAKVQEFFISDTHFLDNGLIRHEKRPPNNDDLIRAKWLKTVSDKDTVYHLGDLARGPNNQVAKAMEGLPGIKILVVGNHDRRSPRFYRGIGFSAVVTQLRIPLDKRTDGLTSERQLLLTHEPLRYVDHDEVNVHGHTHYSDLWGGIHPQINVSVDATGFAPISFNRVRKLALEILDSQNLDMDMQAAGF